MQSVLEGRSCLSALMGIPGWFGELADGLWSQQGSFPPYSNFCSPVVDV